MRFETISTGDEIVHGRSVDTNGPWLARKAAEEGVLRARHSVVGDDPGELARLLARTAERSDFVVITGGLGPTADDHTRAAAVQAGGGKLVLVPELLEEIERRYAGLNRAVDEAARRQAMVPAGSEPLQNPLGTAPGFRLDLHGARLFFLSGVPREMEVMWETHVLPALLEARGPGVRGAYRTLSTFGKAESRVSELLGDLMRREDVSVGVTAAFGVIRVTVQAAGEDAPDLADEVISLARERLGDLVLEAATLPGAVGRLLKDHEKTLATAESCTGGLVGALLTEVSGISRVYLGGVVSYANEVKIRHLGVPEALLDECGAVSEPVARAMAEGARERFGADLAVAVTGIAGPEGGTPEKPVGLVHFALAHPEGVRVLRRIYPGDREFVRRLSAHTALHLVRLWLRNP